MTRYLVILLNPLWLLSPLVAQRAEAQQPLSAFVRAAASRALPLQASAADRDVARSRVDEARAALLPSVNLEAGYTRNEVEVTAEVPGPTGDLQSSVITAQDQVNGTLSLRIPLLDSAAWSRFFGAEARADAADARWLAASRDTLIDVVSAYYRLVAAREVVESSRRSEQTARQHLDEVTARAAAGLSSELDQERARADLARAEQTSAEAGLEEARAARALFVASGLAPDAARQPLESDQLTPEPALARWLSQAQRAPEVQSARLEERGAGHDQDAAWQNLLPVVSADASERYTNAPGFGPEFLWAAGVSLSWQLDFARPAAIETQANLGDRAQVDVAQALQQRETAIYDAWHSVRAQAARVRAARVGRAANERAAEVARASYQAGTGSQFAVSQAERDLLQARVDAARAEADLRVARLTLRLHAGLPPVLGATP